MANFVYIATSLDGFIATKDGGIDWLHDIPNPDQSDFGYAAFMDGIDALVMGRNTFEKVLTFDSWPYQKPVFVLSHTLSNIPDALAGQVEVVCGDLKDVVNQLVQRGFHDLYIDGGKAIQSFLQAGLVDELIIAKVPILLGSGIPLFGELPHPIKLQHVKTEVHANSLVKSHYTVER